MKALNFRPRRHRAGLEPGRKAPLAASRDDLHRRISARRGPARPRGKFVMGRVGAAAWRRKRGPRTAEDVQPQLFERHLGIAPQRGNPGEDSPELARQRTGFELGGQLQVHALFIGHEPETKKVSGFRRPQVDRAMKRLFQCGNLQFNRTDLGRVGAAGGAAVPNPTCSAVHACCPSPAAGFTVRPSGSVTAALFKVEEARAFGASFCGISSTASSPVGKASGLVGVAVNRGAKSTLRSRISAGTPCSASKACRAVDS